MKPGERFVLRERGGWFRIQRQIADDDFSPPMWIDADELGHFRTREDARLFMVAYQQREHPSAPLASTGLEPEPVGSNRAALLSEKGEGT